jgi:hypothetical protein
MDKQHADLIAHAGSHFNDILLTWLPLNLVGRRARQSRTFEPHRGVVSEQDERGERFAFFLFPFEPPFDYWCSRAARRGKFLIKENFLLAK